LLRTIIGRFNAVMAPSVVAASLFGGLDPRMLTYLPPSSATGAAAYAPFQWYQDDWRFMPEYISTAQVEELHKLLSLSLSSGFGFDYFSDED
jgi:hypothetical protein